MAEELGFIGLEADLLIRQGQTFELALTLEGPEGQPYDLTDCTIRGQIRRAPSDPIVVQQLAGELVDALAGTFRIVLTDAQTAAISAGDSLYDAESEYVYDLELVDAQQRVMPLCYGAARVHREITR